MGVTAKEASASPRPVPVTKRVRQALETWLTRVALRVVPHWSRQTVMRVARVAGTVAYYLPLSLRRVALANLDIAFGDTLGKAEKRRILREACRRFALVFLDIFWFARHTRERIATHVTFDPGLDELFQRRAHMCITAHLGNWELLGHAVSVRGNPLSSVAAPLINAAVDEYLLHMRQVSGQIIIPRAGAIRTMLRTLKEDGKVGLLLDQNTRPQEGGVFVDFFGLPAPISDAGASLALKTQTDILFGFCIPEWDGSYYVYTAPKIVVSEWPLTDRDIMVRQLTSKIAETIEQAIRAHPEAWLWMYKRWKFVPPSQDRARYPFYAKDA
jgi:Kdo2-lipid IVA lauroyltransferase/acyltransferase